MYTISLPYILLSGANGIEPTPKPTKNVHVRRVVTKIEDPNLPIFQLYQWSKHWKRRLQLS